jgi:hypothetical protein
MGPVGPRVLWAHFLLLANVSFCVKNFHIVSHLKNMILTHTKDFLEKKNGLNLLDFDNFKFV